MLSLHVSLGFTAFLVSSYFAGYTLMQIPSGLIVDRMGPSRVNKASFLAMSGVFFIFYFSMESFVLLLLIQFSLGILGALVYLSDVSLIQTWFQQRERTISVGIYQTAFFVGASLGEFIIINLASVSLRLPILVLSCLLFGLGILNLMLISDPQHIGMSQEKRKVSISRGIAYVSLVRFSASFAYLGFLSFFTTYLVMSGNLSYHGSGNYSFLAAIGGIFGSPLGGIITDRLSNSKLVPALASTVLIAVIVIGIALTSSFLSILLLVVVMGFLYGFYAAPSMSIATELSRNDDEIGSASGFLNFSAQIGGAVSPIIIGYLTQETGSYTFSFIVIGVVSIIFILPILVLMASGRQNLLYVRETGERS